MFNVSLNGNKRFPIEKVANIDAELEKNMKDENATTMIRTATRVVIRTIAAQQAKKATNTGNGIFDLVKNIAVDVGQTQLEQADLRVGLFMPNSINVTRIPVDAGTHELVISALDSQGKVTGEYKLGKVKVAKGQKKIVLVPSIE
jgi:hypothetical protein